MVILLWNNKIEFHSANDNREYQTFNNPGMDNKINNKSQGG